MRIFDEKMIFAEYIVIVSAEESFEYAEKTLHAAEIKLFMQRLVYFFIAVSELD